MRNNHRRLLVPVSCLLIVSLFFCGCEPLRKKFTRKKKEAKKQEFIPVLDPIDYPPSMVSSQEKYEYHYSMWQVWSKDLQQSFLEEGIDKRKKYIISQIIQHVQELKRWLPEGQQEQTAKVDKMLVEAESIQREFEKPEMMRSQSMIESRLRRMESFMRNELKPILIFGEQKE